MAPRGTPVVGAVYISTMPDGKKYHRKKTCLYLALADQNPKAVLTVHQKRMLIPVSSRF
jgi:hypothetical protein